MTPGDKVLEIRDYGCDPCSVQADGKVGFAGQLGLPLRVDPAAIL